MKSSKTWERSHMTETIDINKLGLPKNKNLILIYPVNEAKQTQLQFVRVDHRGHCHSKYSIFVREDRTEANAIALKIRFHAHQIIRVQEWINEQ